MTTPSIDSILERVRRYFPMQGPIKDFLHFNALSGFQNIPFDKAVPLAAEFYGAQPYMPLSYYRQAYARGQISEGSLKHFVSEFSKARSIRSNLVFKALFDYLEVNDEHVFTAIADKARFNDVEIAEALGNATRMTHNSGPHFLKIREGLENQLHCDIDSQINPALFRVISSFLDQGVTLWEFPSRDMSFFECLKTIVTRSTLPLAAFMNRTRCLGWFSLSPDEVIEILLQNIVGDTQYYESYIKDTLMAHSGWSGMVSYLESQRNFLTRPPSISLKEFLAFKLILEWECIEDQATKFVPLSRSKGANLNEESKQALDKSVLSFAWLMLQHSEFNNHDFFVSADLCRVWHEALEMSAYRELLSAIQVHEGHKKNALRPKAEVQAIFCLDDRECSFRRYLEENDPAIETYGCPGFFGVDLLFQSLNDAEPVQLCPPALSPCNIVRELVGEGQEQEFSRQKAQSRKKALTFELWREASSSLLLGFVAASTLGHLSMVSMFMSLFKPKRILKATKARRIAVRTELDLLRADNALNDADYYYGFSYDEMAVRVENLLRSIGLTHNFAPVVVAIAHGASSANNPHFAAYDCAACSGKSGAPNARVVAQMANRQEVRALLSKRGIQVPESTLFVGAFHDTTTDFVEFFDLDELSPLDRDKVNRFALTVEIVRGLNAKERCRRFDSAPLDVSESQALHEVSKRAFALFEPRAELGHATHFACVIGRRDLTRGLFLDRRAFLNSYDPLADESGVILSRILNAAIPVCGTVNLDYYFSRVDPERYGCGTKLSHNVVGLLGVCNGIDGDLRTGLPVQATELHDPIRLLLVIEQEPALILEVLADNRHLQEWVVNEWVKIASVSPSLGKMTLCNSRLEFVVLENLATQIPVYNSSLACYQGSRGNLPIASILTV